jgi:hypothetical protein
MVLIQKCRKVIFIAFQQIHPSVIFKIDSEYTLVFLITVK